MPISRRNEEPCGKTAGYLNERNCSLSYSLANPAATAGNALATVSRILGFDDSRFKGLEGSSFYYLKFLYLTT